MEQVFAPWRIEWIRRDEPNPEIEECVFCELPDLGDDRENLLVARSEHAFVMLNNYPYNPGHLMVIPHSHTGEYAALAEDVLLDHACLKQRTFDALEAALEPDGFNAGLNLGDGAGGSIDDHLHTHVVPRWEGDTNFMPVLSETTVIVEALEATYDHVHDAFAAQEGTTVPSEGGAVVVE
ncbi:HIT domain-containing protein [Natrinema pallidum]|uniref:Histidine triad protein n=2 Tax=Natrinema pallidum TaxID=69527 RepID=L9YG31_9EURY|nr:HIT domain-containing protein [Natrinema pallidum]ELY72686.1 histidine triad protein [Natrinema pallidum DSM 3751]QCW04493.1 HIT domain-containing protein [Natrinema pallidum]